jgi:hypothetical protein
MADRRTEQEEMTPDPTMPDPAELTTTGESAGTVLARINARASLLLDDPCPHCHETRVVIGVAGALPNATSVEHEVGCPNRVEW